MEAARTSETSVGNYFTRQYIPEDKFELLTGRCLTNWWDKHVFLIRWYYLQIHSLSTQRASYIEFFIYRSYLVVDNAIISAAELQTRLSRSLLISSRPCVRIQRVVFACSRAFWTLISSSSFQVGVWGWPQPCTQLFAIGSHPCKPLFTHSSDSRLWMPVFMRYK
jgi:hypothetical protein